MPTNTMRIRLLSHTASGGVAGGKLTRSRPQINGCVSYFKQGWGGSHTFRVGGEMMKDNLTDPFPGYGNPSNSRRPI